MKNIIFVIICGQKIICKHNKYAISLIILRIICTLELLNTNLNTYEKFFTL